MKIAFESLRNKFQREFFSGSHRFSSLVSVRQNQPSFTSLLYHQPIIVSKLYSISFFKSGILLQQSIAPLEGVSAHFSNVYCTILKEMREREISNLPGQTSQEPLDPFSSNSVVKQNGGVLELFSRFRRGTENGGFHGIQKFFRRTISNNKNIRFSEKKIWGLGALQAIRL